MTKLFVRRCLYLMLLRGFHLSTTASPTRPKRASSIDAGKNSALAPQFGPQLHHSPAAAVLSDATTEAGGSAFVFQEPPTSTLAHETHVKMENSTEFSHEKSSFSEESFGNHSLTTILDMSRQYTVRRGLNFITIYWAGKRTPLLRGLKYLSGKSLFTVHGCPATKRETPFLRRWRAAATPGNRISKNGLHLILCKSAAQILEEGFQEVTSSSMKRTLRPKKSSSRFHWMLLEDDSSSLLDNPYIPLDATAIVVRKSADASYSLEAVWTPAPGLPLRSAPVGHYQPDYRGHNHSISASHSVNGQHQTCPRTGGKGQLCLSDDRLIKEKSDLTGEHLVVTTLKSEKTVEITFDKTLGRFVLAGAAGEIFELLRDIMNFTYMITVPSNGQFGAQLHNGSWTGLIGDLVSGKADVGVGFIAWVESRDAVISFSPTVSTYRFRLFAQIPSGVKYQWESYVRSFDATVWGLCVLVYLALSATFALTVHVSASTSNTGPSCAKRKSDVGNHSKKSNSGARSTSLQVVLVENKENHTTLNPSESQNHVNNFFEEGNLLRAMEGKKATLSPEAVEERPHHRMVEEGRMSLVREGKERKTLVMGGWNSFFVTWSAFVQQGHPTTPRGAALRVLFLVNYLLGLLLLTSYSAMLVSFLTVADSSLPFTSLQSLADHGRYRLGILNASASTELMQSPMYLPFYNRLVKPYSDTLKNNFDDLRSIALADPQYALLASYEKERARDETSCQLTDSKTDIYNGRGSLAYRNGFHYIPIFNHYISVLWESGVISKIQQKNFKAHVCSEHHDMSLRFNQVFTAFLALGGGMGAALVLLLLEMLSRRRLLVCRVVS